jgi:hypothetical protein
MTIQELRKNGNRVRVVHRRFYEGSPLPMTREQAAAVSFHVRIGNIFPRGGITEIYINDGKSKTKYGMADCSLKDNYNKSVGTDIALRRALSNT